jgi:tetratricopeptide (TPR) repeat protein
MHGRIAVLVLLAGVVWAQEPGRSAQQPPEPPAAQAPEKNPPPPRSQPTHNPNDSSSRDTRIDLSPPPGEASTHPDSTDSDVGEMHPWDPHRADKNIEIGDYYLKQRNYRAAVSRYCEALYWKQRDAVATFRLAEALEKAGDLADARQNYEAYLKILPEGPFAAAAKKAVGQIQARPEQPSRGLTAHQLGCGDDPTNVIRSADDENHPVLKRPTSPPAKNPQ